jgi:diaminopimelate epimerase
MRFEKWQALGNDYLIVEEDELPFELTPARVRRLCEGHFGVSADGVLLLSRLGDSLSGDPRFVANVRIFNPDGSEAELSGNGLREAILYLHRRGWTEEDTFTVQTVGGDIHPTITGCDTCRMDMGYAALVSKDFPTGPADGRGELTADGRTWRFQHVSIGNPQCAIAVADMGELQALDLPAIGPAIEGHERFPNRINVSWYTETEPNRIRARIFERGVGETLSSGTGATGAAVAHVLAGTTRPGATGTAVAHVLAGATSPGADVARRAGAPASARVVTVALDGGELEVEVGDDLHINLTGWARPVFSGTLSNDFEKELHETQ